VHAALVLPVIALGLVLLWQDWRQAEATPGATSPRGLFAALTALAQQRPARSPQADR
jgi:hypothetical protein